MIQELVLKNRSYRRFKEDFKIDSETLRSFIALARVTPSAANRQPLKYILSNSAETNVKIFDTLAWAGYLQDWPGPEPGERPSAYIIVLGDTEIILVSDYHSKVHNCRNSNIQFDIESVNELLLVYGFRYDK